MITYQKNTHVSQAETCSRDEFWKSVRNQTNQWRIDSRRDILDVVERHDEQGIKRWLENSDYQKFVLRKQNQKQEALRQEFFNMTDEERLLAFAQEQKNNLTAFIFSCREFDATEKANGKMFRHRRLTDCHLNGLVMLDIDHVDNPLEIWKKLQADEELMNRTALVHVTSSKKGIRVVFTANVDDGNLADNQIVFAQKLGYQADSSCIDATRTSFTPKEEDILYINEELLFDYYDEAYDQRYTPMYREKKTQPQSAPKTTSDDNSPLPIGEGRGRGLSFRGIPYTSIIREWWNRNGGEPQLGERNVKLHRLAVNLRAICDNSKEVLLAVMPRMGLSEEEIRSIVDSACKEQPKGISKLMQSIIDDLDDARYVEAIDDDEDKSSTSSFPFPIRKLPMGIRDSIAAVGPELLMPTITAICPCIGALATGVRLDVHGQKQGLNLIAYVAGDFASGKGQIDPVVEAWMGEIRALDKMYQMQEDEWRNKKRAAKNKKEQPEEPKLPVRFLTLNNTVANLAERLANTEGKHAFSFTPEADTMAQKLKSQITDYSIMLRQSYDGSRYDREARSVDAVNVHIDHLLWNVTMCGTPDALYRVVNNYTDGFQSRIAIARTPDNTFAPLADKPSVLTSLQQDHIQQIAHLLPLMHGEVVLPKLENRGREWLERIRIETMKDDDKVRARQRIRVCVTAQRMTCCMMLCKMCEGLIRKYGLNGAEARLKENPGLWKELLQKAQTPLMLETFDVIADSLLDNALYFFRDRIENAFNSSSYAGSRNGIRTKRGRNDNIFERLDVQFTFEQAKQQAIAVKGAGVTNNCIHQMLKNWRHQNLVVDTENGDYRKVAPTV